MAENGEMTGNPRQEPGSAPPRLTVYYDGGCPMCRSEIAYYRRIDRDGRISFVDLVAPEADTGPDLSCAAALARFHVREPDGALQSGAAGFVRLWRELPGWRWAARVAAIPGVLWVMERAYRAFLPVRPRLARFFARGQ